eukprot:578272-Rhodomonas_salina.2
MRCLILDFGVYQRAVRSTVLTSGVTVACSRVRWCPLLRCAPLQRGSDGKKRSEPRRKRTRNGRSGRRKRQKKGAERHTTQCRAVRRRARRRKTTVIWRRDRKLALAWTRKGGLELLVLEAPAHTLSLRLQSLALVVLSLHSRPLLCPRRDPNRTLVPRRATGFVECRKLTRLGGLISHEGMMNVMMRAVRPVTVSHRYVLITVTAEPVASLAHSNSRAAAKRAESLSGP